jgi:hypothetical protein
MARFYGFALLLLMSGALPAATLPATTAPGFQQRHAQFQQLHDSLHGNAENVVGATLAARFGQLFPEAMDRDALHRTDDTTLHALFDDAWLATYYHPDAAALEAMLGIVAELDARGSTTPRELARTRNALLAARRFEQAAAFGDSHPRAALSPLPRFVDAGDIASGRPSAWREAGNGRFERVALDLGPTQVLVMAGCHFSDDAARGIDADPVLGPLFRTHAHWLGQPPGVEDPADVEAWNTTHPQAPMLPLYDRDEWPMFPRWVMPTFYVVRDGEVLGSVRGWAPAEARAELVGLLQRTGLLPPTTP